MIQVPYSCHFAVFRDYVSPSAKGSVHGPRRGGLCRWGFIPGSGASSATRTLPPSQRAIPDRAPNMKGEEGVCFHQRAQTVLEHTSWAASSGRHAKRITAWPLAVSGISFARQHRSSCPGARIMAKDVRCTVPTLKPGHRDPL